MVEIEIMRELEYPFNPEKIMIKQRKIKRRLLEEYDKNTEVYIKKKIAILGGSTTHDIKEVLNLFLLNYGIYAEYYESEYGKYWEDIMFENDVLDKFKPDIVYIHTSIRNIKSFPNIIDSKVVVQEKINSEYDDFRLLWDTIKKKYGCIIIQNNFEQPFFRKLGNMECSDHRGRIWFINEINNKMYEYANLNSAFYINDINYLSGYYGLEKWSDPYFWYMFKYSLAVPAIPVLSHNIARIIKAIYGKNKKVIALDLDDTLWGGIIGENGADNIDIGEESPRAQIYKEFQEYIKSQKDIGAVLAINSKNDYENAVKGLSKPESVLRLDDFISVQANWESKSCNIRSIAKEINIGEDAVVFIDDSPRERDLVRQQIEGVAVPELSAPEHYIQTIDGAGYFETVSLSKEDINRNSMYMADIMRKKSRKKIPEYDEYLESLDMKASISEFKAEVLQRILQLINKSNQFNLTTKRCSLTEIERISADNNYISLFGRLKDRFGDNGIVTAIYGHKEKNIFQIDLWVMSCRVLKRGMEFAMMDELFLKCMSQNVQIVRGLYFKTAKNGMVKFFYKDLGFVFISGNENGDSIWELDMKDYKKLNKNIRVEEKA